MTSLKRFRDQDDDEKLSWRGEPRFADWMLTWGDDMPVRTHVHRFVLVRSCRFFRGATNDAFQGTSTDLGKLLPDICRPLLEKLVDWIYEGADSVGTLKDGEVPLLYHMADVLQCPSLKNHTLDLIEKRAGARDLTTDDWPLLEAVVSIGDIELFRELLPAFPLEALHSMPSHITEGGAAFAVAAMKQLACRAPFFGRKRIHRRERLVLLGWSMCPKRSTDGAQRCVWIGGIPCRQTGLSRCIGWAVQVCERIRSGS